MRHHVETGQHRGATWAAGYGLGVVLGKRHAFVGERVDIGGFNDWVTELAEGIASPLVNHNHQYILFSACHEADSKKVIIAASGRACRGPNRQPRKLKVW